MMDTSSSVFGAIAEMILFLGIAAVGLAVVGTYGVAAFAAERRSKEFGIRMALGAVRVDIIHLALRSGAKPIALGLLAGLCMGVGASYALVRLMENAPFVLDMHDPLAYFCVSLRSFRPRYSRQLFQHCDQRRQIRYMRCARRM